MSIGKFILGRVELRDFWDFHIATHFQGLLGQYKTSKYSFFRLLKTKKQKERRMQKDLIVNFAKSH